ESNPFCGVLLLLSILCGCGFSIVAAAESRPSQAYGQLPLHFEANRGQTHKDVLFLSRGPGYGLYLTGSEAVLVLTQSNPNGEEKPDVLRMSLVGAAPTPLVSGLDGLPGKVNYFIGKDPAKWRTKIP